MGIESDVASAALAEAFGDVDERAMVRNALAKKLRGKKIATAADHARLFQYLMRQGFPPETVTAVLREARRAPRGDQA
jgi:SOS response regulatory protein OraA/RecX